MAAPLQVLWPPPAQAGMSLADPAFNTRLLPQAARSRWAWDPHRSVRLVLAPEGCWLGCCMSPHSRDVVAGTLGWL